MSYPPAMPTASASIANRRTIPPLAIATILIVLLLAEGASAALPTLTSTRIAPNSLGGVRVGMSLTQAQSAWGAGGYDFSQDAPCSTEVDPGSTCTWRASNTTRAWVAFEDGKAASIGIAGGPASRLARLKTASGYRLGTRVRSFFQRGWASAPVGLNGPVAGATVAYVGRGSAHRGITFFGSRTGRTVAITVR